MSVLGMLSACTNPILYGILNENFKAEYKNIFYGKIGNHFLVKIKPRLKYSSIFLSRGCVN